MIKFAVFALLFVIVSCKTYPNGQKSFRTPALDLLTGGVSEFNVDGRTYGRDLPPLLTGKGSISPLYGNGDQLLGDGLSNLGGSRSGASFQSVAGINPLIPRDHRFTNRHIGIKSNGIPFESGHISGIYPDSKGISGFDGFTRQRQDVNFGSAISSGRQFGKKQSGIRSSGISFQSDHVSDVHPEATGIQRFNGFPRQNTDIGFSSIASSNRQFGNKQSGIKHGGIPFHSDHRTGISPETNGISGFDRFSRQDTDISFGSAISSDRQFMNQQGGIKFNRPSYVPDWSLGPGPFAGGSLGSGPFTDGTLGSGPFTDGRLGSGPFSDSVRDLIYPESRLLNTGRSRKSRFSHPKTLTHEGETQKIPFLPLPSSSEPINNIPFSVNSRSIGREEFRRGDTLPLPLAGTHSSDIGYSGIKAQAGIKFGSSGLVQDRSFGSDILNSRRQAFSGDSHLKESIGSPYSLDHKETSLMGIPKQSNNDFNSFGLPQNQIIHGDDLVSFGRTSINFPAREDRSFESIRHTSGGGKLPSIYPSGKDSIGKFNAGGINSRQFGGVWEQSIGDSAFERNILRNPREGNIPSGGKHYGIPKVRSK
jgi:hypothetical protein